MREQIVINNTHYIGNGTFEYKLPYPKTFKNAKISLQSFAIYNQTPNITAALGNNTFTINWLGTIYNYTIPDGYYTASDLNSFLQYCMLNSGLYLTSSTSEPIYFISILANSIRYAAQINFTVIPTSSQASALKYTKPPNATWTYPTTAQCPILTVSSGLGTILGMKRTLTIPSNIYSNTTVISDVTPILSLVYCYLCTCNLLNSSMSIFNDIFFQANLGGSSYGSLVQINNVFPSSLDVQDGSYSSIIIRLRDQNYNILNIIDNEMTMIILIDY